MYLIYPLAITCYYLVITCYYLIITCYCLAITCYCLAIICYFKLLQELWPTALTYSLGGKACQQGQATSLTCFRYLHRSGRPSC
jgi:hypothetical protein